MPTPEQQRTYTRLSALLQAIGQQHYGEFPNGTVSLSLQLTGAGGPLVVEAYDNAGKPLGAIPNSTTSGVLRDSLDRAFAKETFTDDAIVAIVANHVKVAGA